MRLFVAVELSVDARAHLTLLLQDLRMRLPDELDARLRFRQNPVNWVRDENLHVTLKFLGEAPDPEVPAVCEGLENVEVPRPMLLRVSQFLCLPPRGPVRIIAAGLDGDLDRLQQLHSFVERACERLGFPRERRAFLPHVTVGRLRSPLPAMARSVVSKTANRQMPGPVFDVGGFALVQSELLPGGPRYTPLAHFPSSPPDLGRPGAGRPDEL